MSPAEPRPTQPTRLFCGGVAQYSVSAVAGPIGTDASESPNISPAARCSLLLDISGKRTGSTAVPPSGDGDLIEEAGDRLFVGYAINRFAKQSSDRDAPDVWTLADLFGGSDRIRDDQRFQF